MTEAVYEAKAERTFQAPRALVWALVADTNRYDRAYGLKPATYSWKVRDGRRERVGTASEMGFSLAWVEPPYQWIEGQSVHGQRLFHQGPIDRAGFAVELADAGDTTIVRARAYMASSRSFGRLLSATLRGRQRRGLERFLDAVGRVLEGARLDLEPKTDEPPVPWARRVLRTAHYDEVAAGIRTPVVAEELSMGAERLRSSDADARLSSLLVTFLRDRADEDVAQIRPFELAQVWDADRYEALRTFLHATTAGLLDLRWQINCPVCKVASGGVGSLTDLGVKSHCDACNLDYDVDLASHVEAVFHCNRAVRSVEPTIYCASSPAFLPHVMLQKTLAPGEEMTVELPLPAHLHARTLHGHAPSDLARDHAPKCVSVIVDDQAVRTSTDDAGQSPGTVVLRSEAHTDVTLLVERAGWSADVVLGSVMLSFPQFMDLFATEAPATGVDLRVGHLAVLFTDLTDSTAMYERVGDARAFALVHEHFRVLASSIAAHGGALVKTMGDAVMATFPDAPRAVAAALEMVDRYKLPEGEKGLGVKVGVHAGPCLAVRANDRLDYFGTTVNVAARLQGQARAGQVVITARMAEHPGVRSQLDTRVSKPFEAGLKGVAALQQLVAVEAVRSVPPAERGT